jgi:hypothetical protein
VTPDERIAARAAFRKALFARRGAPPGQLDGLVERLAVRDADRDDRRMCIECAHAQRNSGCFLAAQGRLPGVSRWYRVIPLLLQRCAHFVWQQP